MFVSGDLSLVAVIVELEYRCELFYANQQKTFGIFSQGIFVSYFMNNLMGESIDSPDEAQIRQTLAELEKADDEHTDVSLGHESGWTLSVFRDKRLLWENVEDPDVSPREATLDSWDDVVGLLLELSRGNIEAVDAFGWDS
ncbi:hypothetical protein [Streptomyces sp. NPDC006134]|uniref:hypothetical protein n=1 Tax=Streptomyces sp. NPDC006134 TaxID=3154467 RepID=UPI0033C24066